jgi:hypothetical protein
MTIYGNSVQNACYLGVWQGVIRVEVQDHGLFPLEMSSRAKSRNLLCREQNSCSDEKEILRCAQNDGKVSFFMQISAVTSPNSCIG